jgi:hypothetical protein
MIESPLLNEMLAKATAQGLQKGILRVLARRFGPVPEDVAAVVRTVIDETNLNELTDAAVSCRTLKAFREHLKK